MNTTTINEKLKTLFANTGFECYSYADFESADELIDDLREQINSDEVIYYSNAMEYLSKNDASLQDSMALAAEMGYEAKNINSELLATLLQQQNLNEELNGLTDEITAIYEGKE